MPKLSLVFDYLTSNKKVLFCNRNQKINCQTLVLYSDQGNTVTDIQEQIRNFVCRLAADPKNLKSCPCTVTPLMVLRKQDTLQFCACLLRKVVFTYPQDLFPFSSPAAHLRLKQWCHS